jgi:hypothetical protein
VSEQFSERAGHAAVGPDSAATGFSVVDAVIDSLADLDGRPVSEHAAVFEAAHDRLRDALANAGDDYPAS